MKRAWQLLLLLHITGTAGAAGSVGCCIVVCCCAGGTAATWLGHCRFSCINCFMHGRQELCLLRSCKRLSTLLLLWLLLLLPPRAGGKLL